MSPSYTRVHSALLSAALTGAIALFAPQSFAAAQTITHQTAKTQFVTVDGVKLAYRRFGKPGGTPLVFFQHFVGTMDGWDPLVTDGLARDREVILFDNAGVSSSEGTVPDNIAAMARYAEGLIDALHIQKADLLGFSMGSFVAQQVTIDRPRLVRKLILIGTSNRAGVGMASLTPEFQGMLAKKHDVPDELLLDVFFTPSPASRATGRKFLDRLRARKENRDPEVNDKVAPAQAAAIAGWGKPGQDPYGYLAAITQPVLVADGSKDLVFYTVNDFNLQQHLPDAQLIVYPDGGHGVYGSSARFLEDAAAFLDR
jgi:pimeloyl-ACP methyl ester carboxylesterase